MPSYDLVSSLDMGELKNAINMAMKKIAGRFDFKGSTCTINLKSSTELEIIGDSEYQVGAALEILYDSMGKRSLSLKGLEPDEVKPTGNKQHKQIIKVLSGIDKEKSKIINKAIKDSKIKVTSQYLDEKIRVSGKKIDDLREVFSMLREHKDVNIPLAMENLK